MPHTQLDKSFSHRKDNAGQYRWSIIPCPRQECPKIPCWAPSYSWFTPIVFQTAYHWGPQHALFADDCLVYWEVKGFEDQEILQKVLQSLQEWAKRWSMRFNAKRCNIIHLSRNKPKHHFYSLFGKILQVEYAKYQGVTISDNLKWEKHVNGITSKTNSTLHFISRSLRYSPERAHPLANFALVYPTLENSCAVWHPHFKKDVDHLELVNCSAPRIVTGRNLRDREVSVTALLEDLKWTTLQEQQKHLRLVLMYNILNGLVAMPAIQLIAASQHTRAIHKHKFSIIRTNCDIAKYSFYSRTIPKWNSLKTETVDSPSVEALQAHLSRH